jgi:hypothetical protein
VYASGITKNRQYNGKIGERRARVNARLFGPYGTVFLAGGRITTWRSGFSGRLWISIRTMPRHMQDWQMPMLRTIADPVSAAGTVDGPPALLW